jgi:hypothetical protein
MKKLVIILALIMIPRWSVMADEKYPCDDRPKITVNGEAVVNVRPDKIVISLGIETWEADITLAKRENNDILKKAIAVIKACGIPESDIQTDYLSIEPRYKDDYRKDTFLGYFVRNAFVVTLKEPDKVEELVTKILASGVNYLQGIDFQTTEFKKYREQARELALKAAKEKAEKMAAVLGQTVGSPVQINEAYSGSPWWYYSSWSGWGFGRSQGMSQNVIQDVRPASGEISDTIALGKISIRANVMVTFEMKK